MIRFFSCALMILLTGCASEPARLATSSGRPEVEIQANPERVKAAVLHGAAINGYKVIRETEHQIAIDIPSDNVFINMLFASQMNPQAHVRVNFTIIPQGQSTQVFASAAIVRNPGTAFEHETMVQDQDSYEGLQSVLLRLTKAAAS